MNKMAFPRTSLPQGEESEKLVKKVAMVLEQPFPPDGRVEREALALTEAGYEVHLLCFKRKPEELEYQNYRGIHVYRVRPKDIVTTFKIPFTGKTIRSRFLYAGLIRTLRMRINGVEADWRKLIFKFLNKTNPDLIHVHDLRLLPTVLSLVSPEETPVVADLHENYPALVAHMVENAKGKAKAEQKKKLWCQIEKRSLPKASKIITVVENARERVLQYPNIAPSKVSVVQNVVDSEKFLAQSHKLSAELEKQLKNRFVLCYVGHVNSRHRGIQTILEAMPKLISEIPEIFFLAAGSVRGCYQEQILQPLIEKGQLQNYIHFTGQCDETEFVPYIQRADICLCPHLKSDVTDATFPNKVFLYGLFEKPMVVSSCLPLSQYVSKTQSGLVYESGNPQALTEQIVKLYNDSKLRKSLGKQGKYQVEHCYCWENEKQKLLAVYESLSTIRTV